MKNLILIFAFILPQAHASISPLPTRAEIFCQTEFPTTSMLFAPTDDGQYRLRVTHHNGEKFAPIHKGIITSNDLENLVRKGQLIQQMGTEYSIDFEAEDCSLVDPKLNEVVCYKRTPTTLGSLTLQSLSFHNYQKVSRLFGKEFKTFVMSVGMTHQNRGMSVDMDYTPGDCWVRI